MEPIQDATYFCSPVSTLLRSVQDPSSCLDVTTLCDAYHTLLSRIQSQSHHFGITLSEPEVTHTALEYMRQNSHDLASCLLRDISRILPDRHADVDLRTICHHAMRLIAVILKFQVLHTLFSSMYHAPLTTLTVVTYHALTDLDLEQLLATLIKIADSSINRHRKTHSLALWTLRTQRLPESVLSAHLQSIVGCIGTSIVPNAAQVELHAIDDSLKILQYLLSCHGCTTLRLSVPYLPAVLFHLTSPVIARRQHSVRVLCAYVIALRHSTHDLKVSAEISEMMGAYIQVQTSRQHKSVPCSLASLLMGALADHNSSPVDLCAKPSVPWAAITVACIILLSDSALFTRPRTLKLLMPVLSRIRKPWPWLHASIWMCLVEKLGSLYEHGSKSATNDNVDDDLADLERTRDAAFKIVKQELAHGIGASLASRLSEPPTGDVGLYHTTLVVEEMVKSNRTSIHQDGVQTLLKMLTRPPLVVLDVCGPRGPDQPCHPQPTQDIVPAFLLDGSLLNADDASLPTFKAKTLHSDHLSPRMLLDEEIVGHWDMLVGIWRSALERCIGPTFQPAHDTTRHNLVAAWQSLLLAQTQLSQGRGHLTAPPEFIERAATIVASVLIPTGDIRNGRRPISESRLRAARELWDAMQNVFEGEWHYVAAENVLRSFLSIEDGIAPDQGLEELSLNVALDAGSSVRGVILRDERYPAESRKRLWISVALFWTTAVTEALFTEQELAMHLIHSLQYAFNAWASFI
jgi:hypothetical protein